MDLFVVERYNGDAPKAEADVSAEKSTHLQRLLLKIEEKKRLALELKAKEEKQAQARKEKEERKREKTAKKHAKKQEKKEITKKSQKKVKKTKASKEKLLSDTVGQFTILGDASLGEKKLEVDAQLPHWLACPSIVSVDLQNLTVSINDIPQLDKDIIEKLRSKNITHFFPVQHQVIPCLLEAQGKPRHFWPRDVCVSAPTGSGKTYAFVLPIVQALRSRFVPHIRALVILPVQDLANQVYKVFQECAKGITDLKIVCLNGKESFTNEQSKLVYYSEVDQKFCSCADIVITTPGRLVDHLQLTKGFSLHHLKYLVIDEADRVMESMQNDWLYHLDNHLSLDQGGFRVASLTIKDITVRRPPPQKLLFSATLSNDPELLKELGLFQPRLFTSIVSGNNTEQVNASSFIGKFTTPAELSEEWVLCNLETKPLYLYHLITEGNWKRVIVFTNSVKTSHRLAVLMKHLFKDNLRVEEMTAALNRQQRGKMLKDFASGAINILVSSDLVSRGIDIPVVDCVVSYDTPKCIRTYIHRVGRTGRAGHQGTAVTFLLDKQKPKFITMLKQAEKDAMVKERVVDTSCFKTLEDKYREALTSLKQEIVIESEKELEKMKGRSKKREWKKNRTNGKIKRGKKVKRV